LAIAGTENGTVSDPTAVHDVCSYDTGQLWAFDEDAHLHALGVGDGFLEVHGDPEDSGNIVRVAAPIAPAADNQQWSFDAVHLSNLAGLCIDVPFGNFVDGAAVQLFTCHDGDAQSFSVTTLGQIQHGSYCMDLPGGLTEDGTRLQMYTCQGNAPDNQSFVLEQGQLRPRNSGKCVGVAGDPTMDHVALEVQSCDSSGSNGFGQSFWLYGPIMNRGLCLDIGTPHTGSADPVALEACAGTPEQTWSWHF